MRAAILRGRRDIVVTNMPLPEPGAADALVRVHRVGLGPLDANKVLWDGPVDGPIVLGREIAGQVVDSGPDFPPELLGRKVAIAPLIPCHRCERCIKGHYPLCLHQITIGQEVDGGLAEYVTAPVSNVVPADDTVNFRDLAFLRSAATALHGLRRGGSVGGVDVMILGATTFGLLAMQWARILGARSVGMIGSSASHLGLAARLGADAVFGESDRAVEEVRDWRGGGFGYLVETTGRSDMLELAFELAEFRADIAIITDNYTGLAGSSTAFELMNLMELRLTGSWRPYVGQFPGLEWEMAAQCLADGRLRVLEDMVHDTITLDDVPAAFSLFEEPGLLSGALLVDPQPMAATGDDEVHAGKIAPLNHRRNHRDAGVA